MRNTLGVNSVRTLLWATIAVLFVSAFEAYGGDAVPLGNLDAPLRNAIFATTCDSGLDRAAVEKTFNQLEQVLIQTLSQVLTKPPPQMDEDPEVCSDLMKMLQAVREVREVFRHDELRPHLHCAHHKMHQARDRLAAIRWRNGCTAFSDRLWGFHHAFHEAVHTARHVLVRPDVKLSDAQWARVQASVEQAQLEMAGLEAICQLPPLSKDETIAQAMDAMRASLSKIGKACKLRSESMLKTEANALREAFRAYAKTAG